MNIQEIEEIKENLKALEIDGKSIFDQDSDFRKQHSHDRMYRMLEKLYHTDLTNLSQIEPEKLKEEDLEIASRWVNVLIETYEPSEPSMDVEKIKQAINELKTGNESIFDHKDFMEQNKGNKSLMLLAIVHRQIPLLSTNSSPSLADTLKTLGFTSVKDSEAVAEEKIMKALEAVKKLIPDYKPSPEKMSEKEPGFFNQIWDIIKAFFTSLMWRKADYTINVQKIRKDLKELANKGFDDAFKDRHPEDKSVKLLWSIEAQLYLDKISDLSQEQMDLRRQEELRSRVAEDLSFDSTRYSPAMDKRIVTRINEVFKEVKRLIEADKTLQITLPKTEEHAEDLELMSQRPELSNPVEETVETPAVTTAAAAPESEPTPPPATLATPLQTEEATEPLENIKPLTFTEKAGTEAGEKAAETPSPDVEAEQQKQEDSSSNKPTSN